MLKKLEKLQGIELTAALRAANISVRGQELLDNFEYDSWHAKVLTLGRDAGVAGDYIDSVVNNVGNITFGVGEKLTGDQKGKCLSAALALIQRALEPEAFRESGRQ